MMNKRKTGESARKPSGTMDSLLEDRLKSAMNEPRIAVLEEAMSRYYNGNSFPWKKFVVMAAVFIMVIAIPSVIFFVRDSGEKGLFNSYFAPNSQQQITGIYRGLDAENNTPFLLFSMGKFQKALPELRSYLNEYPSDMQARLMMAICLMDAGNFNEAETELKGILTSGNFYFNADAHWYLALIQVRKGNYTQAVNHLNLIGNSSIYALQVQSLQKKLLKKTSRLLTFLVLRLINR